MALIGQNYLPTASEILARQLGAILQCRRKVQKSWWGGDYKEIEALLKNNDSFWFCLNQGVGGHVPLSAPRPPRFHRA